MIGNAIDKDEGYEVLCLIQVLVNPGKMFMRLKMRFVIHA